MRDIAATFISLIRALPSASAVDTGTPFSSDWPEGLPSTHALAERAEAYLADNPDATAEDLAWLVASLAQTHAEAVTAMR